MYAPRRTRFVDNRDGWELEVKVYRDPDHFDPSRPPIVMVPGYAMNTFILAYHPGGTSLIEFLARRGWEVWSSNLRGQGGSRPTARAQRFGMAELALNDLPVVFEHVRAHTQSTDEGLIPIGCSLGATFMFGYLAHHRHDHPFRGMVSLGGPLRWDEIHPLVKVAFRSSRLAGALRIRGTRPLAKWALPLVTKVPVLLSPYMNAERIDLSRASDLVHTIENPVPHINRQVAKWMRQKDLMMRGRNVSEALAGLDELDTLAIYANADGIVPPGAARSVAQILPEERVTLIEVGDDAHWYAHADMFIGDRAETQVFEPLHGWLSQYVPAAA
jgi:pimeloyl-ACP methyl ester carboxylesterase